MITSVVYTDMALKKDLWNAITESRGHPEDVIGKMAEKRNALH